MEFEGIGSIAMCDLGVEVGWKVNNRNRLERTSCNRLSTHHGRNSQHSPFNANTTTYAQELGDKRNLVAGLYLNTKLALNEAFMKEFEHKKREVYSPIFTTGHDYVCITLRPNHDRHGE
jgi:hypothetical protein